MRAANRLRLCGSFGDSWAAQNFREAQFPYQAGQRFLIFDLDSKYGLETPIAVRSMGLIPVRTSSKVPGKTELPSVGSKAVAADLLDHGIAMNEAHLKRLLSEYVSYFHEDRTHLGLQKETPGRRVRAAARGGVSALTRLGGLHHRYERVA